MQVTIKPSFPKEIYEVYKRDHATWWANTQELVFNVNVSSSKESWRLVYWDGKIICLFESKGFTHTINHLFCGTQEQCSEEVKRLKLKEEDAKISR